MLKTIDLIKKTNVPSLIVYNTNYDVGEGAFINIISCVYALSRYMKAGIVLEMYLIPNT